MKKYNRALDYTVLALDELSKGKPVLAARLLAKAAEQKDLPSAIAILEASNKQAFKSEQVTAKKRLTAGDDFPFEDGQGEGELAADLGEDFDGDPLDEVGEDDVAVEADLDEMDDGDDEAEDDDDDGEDAEAEIEEEVTAKAKPAQKVSASVAMARVLARMERKAR